MITEAEISEDRSNFILEVEDYGERLYTEYKKERLVEKTKQIFDTISKPIPGKKKVSAEKEIKPEKELLTLIRTVDIARARGYDLRNLLRYEIAALAFYLFTSTNSLKTPTSKSDLLKEVRILTTLKKVPIKENSAVVIDFMAHARKVSGKKNKLQIKTFGDWFEHLWSTFLDLNEYAERIDIVFDLYLKTSRKDGNEEVELLHQESKLTSIGEINRYRLK